MVDPVIIEFVSKVDFSKGFQHFHIQWPLKDLVVPKRSVEFETKVVCGDQSLTIFWSLSIEKDKEDPTKTWFVATSRNWYMITSIIFRVSLSSAGNVLFDVGSLSVVDVTEGFGRLTSADELEKFGKEGDLMLKFWFDIPKELALGDNSKRSLPCMTKCVSGSIAGFIVDAGKMFSRVVETDHDATSDVTLIIIDEEENEIRRFHCHTIVLVSRSTVFERMFSSDKWKENCTKNDRSVIIDDISEEDMETLLRFIYTSELPVIPTSRSHLIDMIYAADKYNLDILKNWCASRLIHDRTNSLERLVPFRYEYLVLADRHNLVHLKSVCLAHLSLCFPNGFYDHVMVERSDLWSEIEKAVSERQANTTNIVLPAK